MAAFYFHPFIRCYFCDCPQVRWTTCHVHYAYCAMVAPNFGMHIQRRQCAVHRAHRCWPASMCTIIWCSPTMIIARARCGRRRTRPDRLPRIYRMLDIERVISMWKFPSHRPRREITTSITFSSTTFHVLFFTLILYRRLFWQIFEQIQWIVHTAGLARMGRPNHEL